MSARDRILGRLKQSVPRQALPVPVLSEGTKDQLSGDSLSKGLVDFIAALTASRAEIIDARGLSWVALLENICKEKGVRRLLVPHGLNIHPAWDSLVIEPFDRSIESFKRTLFTGIDAGLTVADCGLADTGVLAQRSSPQQPRTLSLVPPVHFCLINVNRLYPNLPAALEGEGWAATMPSNLIFISGPSKTADIQQTLAYGAHGPKEMIVFLVEEDVL